MRGGEVGQVVGAGHDRAHLAAAGQVDERLEVGGGVHGRADQGDVGQVEAAYVELDQVAAERPRDHPSPAVAQQAQGLGDEGAGHHVDDHVDALGAGSGQGLAQVALGAVDGHVRARGPHLLGVHAAGDRHDPGPTGRGELHGRQPHAAGGAGDHHGVGGRRVPALEHAQRGAVGDRQRGQLDVAERRAVDDVGPLGVDDHELGEAAVGLAAEDVGRVRVGPVVVVARRRVDQHPAPHQVGGGARAGGHDLAGDVAALDAGEVDGAPPARAGLGGLRAAAVGALAGPQVGVVEAGGAHPHQHLAGARLGGRNVPLLDGLGTAVPGQHCCAHRAGGLLLVHDLLLV